MAFSVVVPVYNKRPMLARTVACVLRQDFVDFELILVDDGSTDGSLEAVVDVADPRLRIIRQANAGPGPARNAGVAAARHEWVAFLDADDLWRDGHLSELHRLRTAFPGAGLIGAAHGHVSLADAARTATSAAPPDEGGLARIDYVDAVGRGRRVLITSSAAVRASAWREAGGFGAFPSGEDSELWVRLALGWPVAVSSRETAIYVQHTDGITDRRRLARLSEPFRLDDLSPAVATLRRLAPEADSTARYVARYFHWRIWEALQARDLAALRILAPAAPAGLSMLDRLILQAARLPSPLFRALYGSAAAARRPFRRLTMRRARR